MSYSAVLIFVFERAWESGEFPMSDLAFTSAPRSTSGEMYVGSWFAVAI